MPNNLDNGYLEDFYAQIRTDSQKKEHCLCNLIHFKILIFNF